jgi:hypothetical protein
MTRSEATLQGLEMASRSFVGRLLAGLAVTARTPAEGIEHRRPLAPGRPTGWVPRVSTVDLKSKKGRSAWTGCGVVSRVGCLQEPILGGRWPIARKVAVSMDGRSQGRQAIGGEHQV